MKHLILSIWVALVASLSAVSAQTTVAASSTATDAAAPVDLSDFLWIKRPVVVFADTPDDPRFVAQMKFLNEGMAELEERDVVVLVDTNPEAKTSLRQDLRPRDFQLVLIGKDGQVALRKPLPWTVREISRVIDKMPMRQQEIGR